MANTKDIQRRIKSVTSTKKVTKAMEMVAASKMRKSVEAVLKTRTYANLSWQTVLNLSKAVNIQHPLLTHPKKEKKSQKIGVILITSNRGLCGGFNTAIVNKVHDSVKKHTTENGDKKIKHEFIIIGKKARAVHKYYGYNIVADFPKLDIISEVKEILPISSLILADYLSGKYDKIMLAYTDFVNPSKQVPRVKQLLPIDITTQDEFLGEVSKSNKDNNLEDEKSQYEYKFEPSPEDVLDEMIPRLIEVQLFQALLESNASEHSARMSAMHQATDAAKDMVDELTLFYNKARQASITAEISEISAGADALK